MSRLSTRQIHLDFHTPSLPFALGKDFNKSNFQKILKKACVNSVTLTGRCHHGYIYYQTKMDAKHPQLETDFLMDEIHACHEVGIKAPIYLSVGWDAFMAEKHPEWLERKPDGSFFGFENFGQLEPGWKTLCFNTPYLDYLKEQIVDTMKHIGDQLDGLFFDIVWQDPCCCNYCIAKMLKQGFNPQDLNDRVKFAKITERRLKDEIYQTVKKVDKKCPVFFNEGNITPDIRPNLYEYSHLEIESLPSGEWGYQHFPTVVRYVKNLGKEYLGMTGKFHKIWADFGSYKNQEALEYESFLSLAHGGKCSIGDQMYPNGELQDSTYELIGNVYRQVKKLEEYNQDVSAVTEIAVLHPGVVKTSEEKVDISLAGAVNILNESGYQFDIIDHLMDWKKYKVIIFPDYIILNELLAEKTREYLLSGGRLLATYQSGLRNNKFLDEWGIKYIGNNSFVPTYGIFKEDIGINLPKDELVLHGEGVLIEPRVGTKIFGEEIKPFYQRNYLNYYSHFQAPKDQKTGYPIVSYSENVLFYTHSFFEMYKKDGVRQYKELILNGLKFLLDGEKLIRATLPTTADVILNNQSTKSRLILNVLHYIPQRKALHLDTIEDRIPLYNVEIKMDTKEIFKKIDVENNEVYEVLDIKESKRIQFLNEGNFLYFNIPVIDGYQIIVLNYRKR